MRSLSKYDKKVRTEAKYLDDIESRVSFRRAMDIQIGKLVKAVEEEDYSLYTPMKIR